MPSVGIVLSGGMAKGAYQIGALRAIGEFIPRENIAVISGASVGSLNAYAYATDNLGAAEDMWRGMDYSGRRAFTGYVMQSDYLHGCIGKIAVSRKPSFSTFVPLFNLNRFEIEYINMRRVRREYIADMLTASVSLPAMTGPVHIGGDRYYDGAMVDNIPIHPLLRLEPDIVICVYFEDSTFRFENEQVDRRVIRLCFRDDTMLKHSLFFNKTEIARMLEQGYTKSHEVLSKIMPDGLDQSDAILLRNARRNAHCAGQFRITGDVVMNNVNKISKRLAGRRVVDV